MDENIKYIIEPIFGSVKLETRMVPMMDGSIAFQGRAIHKDENGKIEKETPWETNAVLR
jgi:hypothetical protein